MINASSRRLLRSAARTFGRARARHVFTTNIKEALAPPMRAAAAAQQASMLRLSRHGARKAS
jgi:hypothetical protein